MSFQFVCENESEYGLVHLGPGKYLSKARHKKIIICRSTLMPLSLLPDVWTKANRAGANAGREPRKAHRGLVYMEPPAVFLVPFTAVQGVPLCPVLYDPEPQPWLA